PKFTPFQLAIHAAALAPLAVLLVAALTGGLSVNPIQDATFRTGKTAMVLLVASLACTPANTVFGFRPAIKVRRALGLYAFLYAAIHFSIFIGLDYGFDLRLVALELAEKRYILVGAAALLILLPLAVTSTKGWQRRLGKTWKKLHRWVYLAGVLVIFHYIWVQKSDIREPIIWGTILGVLLVLRVPAVRKRAAGWRGAIGRLRRDSQRQAG
ncbi:MAG TPA: protein-methionine-sulfoxide reductase heme-binding subunit MsrQ, partial [Anaerolineae bacterium]|nr:protein-methionine-sulfoxide reductase heme-binding subunit MsrQ [Anaerolineae bacterium]